MPSRIATEEMSFRYEKKVSTARKMITLFFIFAFGGCIIYGLSSDNLGNGIVGSIIVAVYVISWFGVLVGSNWMLFAKDSNYSLEVKENVLIYRAKKEEMHIHLPCLVMVTQKGEISSKGNRVTEQKIKFGGLEFDARDVDVNGKLIGEFLKEVNVKALQTSKKDSFS